VIGQVSTELPDGGLALSSAKDVEEGARTALILAPGLFRLDVTPREDTLKLQVRSLGAPSVDWHEGGEPLVLVHEGGVLPSAHTMDIDLGERRAHVLITANRNPTEGVMHFAAQARVSAT
jgi:hypothetical protein